MNKNPGKTMAMLAGLGAAFGVDGGFGVKHKTDSMNSSHHRKYHQRKYYMWE